MAGKTTLSPGTWANHASRLCECWAAAPVPPPPGARTTSGTSTLPPYMKWSLAAWFTIGSMALTMKSENWISTIGRRPVMAAPTPSPTMASSEIGVSRTRASPNSWMRPSVTPKAPPYTPMSSPARKTRSSSASSSRRAEETALA